MRILFLSRRFLRVRLGYVTEINRPIGTGTRQVSYRVQNVLEILKKLRCLMAFQNRP